MSTKNCSIFRVNCSLDRNFDFDSLLPGYTPLRLVFHGQPCLIFPSFLKQSFKEKCFDLNINVTEMVVSPLDFS